MEPYADWSDVKIGRSFTSDEIESVVYWIDQASQMVRDSVPDVGGYDVDERITAGSLSAATVRDVVAGMVRRVMLNPEGNSATTEQTGPFAVTKTKATANAAGDLYIKSRELSRLMGKRDRRQVAYMITPGPGPVFT
jgi:hypothetical protein